MNAATTQAEQRAIRSITARYAELTPRQQCFLRGHALDIEHPEPEAYPQLAPRIVCLHCDAEETDPRVVRRWQEENAADRAEAVMAAQSGASCFVLKGMHP
ncbi:MAG: hypothetical protein V4757_07375 [Pseudomonadota bacterium]